MAEVKKENDHTCSVARGPLSRLAAWAAAKEQRSGRHGNWSKMISGGLQENGTTEDVRRSCKVLPSKQRTSRWC